ncbi:MAG: hypothetical protein EOP00_00130 [Pedobacter sp.]|nr:MAG: hypothetical protein EOP00_00130 [Pedobacter sp.]
MKIATRMLVLLMLSSILNVKAQQIKFPENFKLNRSLLPGYKVVADGLDKTKKTENVEPTDLLYTQRFESADKKNSVDIYVYQLKSGEVFNEKEFIERLQLMQAYLQMFDLVAFEFLKVKNFLIQVQSLTPKAINKNTDKVLVSKLTNYYKQKLAAVSLKIPPVQNAANAAQSATSSTNSPDYTNLKRWVANNFGTSFYQQYIHEGSLRITLLLNIDGQGKTTVKEIKGTNNQKLINAIKDRVDKMPLWTKDEASYSSTLSLPIDFKDVDQ